jgi:hypothetical protein
LSRQGGYIAHLLSIGRFQNDAVLKGHGFLTRAFSCVSLPLVCTARICAFHLRSPTIGPRNISSKILAPHLRVEDVFPAFFSLLVWCLLARHTRPTIDTFGKCGSALQKPRQIDVPCLESCFGNLRHFSFFLCQESWFGGL